MTSPMSTVSVPPSVWEMSKVDTAGTHTMVMPERMPGILRGRTTLPKVWAGVQPRSSAASMSRLSIFRIVAYRGRII